MIKEKCKNEDVKTNSERYSLLFLFYGEWNEKNKETAVS